MSVKISKGSIIPMEDKPKARCRKWVFQCYVNKRPRQKKFSGTYQDAVGAFAEWRLSFGTEAGKRKDALLSDYFSQYLDARLASGAIAKSTYERCVNRKDCFCYNLKGRTVREITPELVERNFALLRQGRSPSGKKLSGTYLNSIKQTASGMFDRARRDGYADRNPFAEAETPRPDTHEKAALTASEAVSFLGKLNCSEPTQAALMLCLTQGLRRSEAVGLRWDDMSGGKMRIRKSKTRAGVRTIPITGACEELLSKVERRGAFVCSCPDGSPVTPEAVSKWLARNRDSLGFPGVTPHVLRHTYATLLAESGATPAAMQKLLGHSSPVTSLKIYTHVHEQQLDGTVAALDNMLGQAKGQRKTQAQAAANGRDEP